MNLKWIGTATILLGCGGFGFKMVLDHRQQTKELQSLLQVLELLRSELRYRLTPLPQLCRMAAETVPGSLGRLFLLLNHELEQQIAPDAACCMNAAVAETNLSHVVKGLLLKLGRTLGRFDLEGQLRGIDAVQSDAEHLLTKLIDGQESRLRSYQTLGLCAGAALAILLL